MTVGGSILSRIVWMTAAVLMTLIVAATAARPVAAQVPDPLDDFVGEWAGTGEGDVTASIRRGSRDPSFLVIGLGTMSDAGCGGGTEVYGRLDVDDICRIDLEMVGGRDLRVDEVSGCVPHHGAACGFSADLRRDWASPRDDALSHP